MIMGWFATRRRYRAAFPSHSWQRHSSRETSERHHPAFLPCDALDVPTNLLRDLVRNIRREFSFNAHLNSGIFVRERDLHALTSDSPIAPSFDVLASERRWPQRFAEARRMQVEPLAIVASDEVLGHCCQE